MSASHAPVIDAIAFQLAAALESYDQHVAVLVDTWLDMGQYGVVSDQVEEIRMLSAALPQLSVYWVELLITHAELVHSLWRFRESEADRSQLEEVRARHAACIGSLRMRCLRLIARSSADITAR